MLPKRLASVLADPPRAYSPAPIWWWSGERLDRDRLRWQLERFAEGGVYNLVILNLAPSGPAHGSDADDPPFFSEGWWELFLGVCDDAQRLGVSLWFYDQLGFSGADIQARLVARRPEFAGRRLHRDTATGGGPLTLRCPTGARPLAATVERLDTDDRPTGRPRPVPVRDGRVRYEATGPARLSLYYERDHGFDYLSPAACAALLDEVHGEFERRLGDRLGTVVVGSFQDELPSAPTWSATFAEDFERRYGYQLTDRLDALWDGDRGADVEGERVRRDYHALRAVLAEEAFFIPLADWHARHGLLVGCDQQDPARAGHPVEGVRLYADYPRTHRWFSAPGSDHHGDARIHSSLAHLYGQPRTWIESFHSTGWGGTLEETLDWLLPWLRTGATLYNPHAVYYSTRAGWWEWAPPSTDWRQPYWRHHRDFADTVARTCAALSLGHHVCDLAVLHPTTTAQADLRLDGVGAAGARAQAVYRELIGDAAWFAPTPGVLDRLRLDADVIDDDSVAVAKVHEARLRVAGEAYAAVVLPAATVLTGATARQLDEFVVAGGRLVAVGALPERGIGDEADAAVARLRAHFDTGTARFVPTAAELATALAGLTPRVEAELPTLTREIDGALAVFVTATEWSATEVGRRAERGIGHDWADVGYRFDPGRYRSGLRVRVHSAPGPPVLVSLFGNEPRPVPYTVDGEVTEVTVPFDDGPAALLVFTPAASPDLPPAPAGPEPASWQEIVLDGEFDSQLVPTLDNTWGDFAWPAGPLGCDAATGLPVAERWALAHRLDGVDGWRPAHATFGPHGLAGPDGTEVEYSDSRGIRKDRIHHHALGPKGHVPEEFLDFGKVEAGQPVDFRTSFTLAADEPDLTLAVGAPAAKQLWLDGAPLQIDDRGGHLGTVPVRLSAGRHELQLRLIPDTRLPLRAHLAFVRDPARYRRPEWITLTGEVPGGAHLTLGTTVTLPTAPPGEGAGLHLTVFGQARLLVNGVEVGRQGGFAPYERPTPQLRRYDLAGALRPGENELVVELSQPSPVLVDGLLGSTAVVSDDDWWGRVDGEPAPVLRHRRYDRMLPNLYLRRRPHPLPCAGWLDGSATGGGDGDGGGGAGAVLPVTFAVPRPPGAERIEWLRFDIPPGTTRLECDVRGAAEFLLDGADDGPLASGTGRLAVELPTGPDQRGRRLGLLRVRTHPGYEAGAALAGPIRCVVGPGRLGLGDWQEHGLSEFSGGVRYRRRLSVPAAGRIVLDLGRVRGTAEVTVDGQRIGARFCSPYVFDLTGLAPGEHVLDIGVFGTVASYLDAVSPTHFVFAGQRVSGLFGPVRLRWSAPTSANGRKS